MAALCLPRHRDLVRGMIAELEAIADPTERRGFALGAMAAIARLTFWGLVASLVRAAGGFVHPNIGGLSMLTPQALLRRLALPFVVSFGSLTALLLANYAVPLLPQLRERGVSTSTIAEVLLFSIPHTIALSIPMGVFLAVTWVFARLGKEGVLESVRDERHGRRRLIVPVLGAAAAIAAVTFVSNTEVVPRANAQLEAVLTGAPMEPNDRTMTLGELREASAAARAETGAVATRRALRYEVEIQKKFALAAACMFLALAGTAAAMRFPRGGKKLVLGASGLVFTGYWLSLVAGESLADQAVVSPVLAMWMANVVTLGFVLLLLWTPGGSDATREGETLPAGT
ncbi:MAG: LptF/LptG family permease [Gemmatimonadetes bacterium]|nr:LptF/LptG family permease [Gemmatimonadota bacterium]